MIVGFSRHSSGGGSGPVHYLTKTVNGDGTERNPKPTVVRGDPELVRRLIDALPFERTYTSGVLSFAPGERITSTMEQRIIDAFERVAFAGLEPDRYSILWVRHQHAGHHELHFVTPRVELASGKSLNIHPPGRVSKKLFDTFRSMINAEYGLADPDDPARAKDVSLPNHIAKLQADANRKGAALQNDLRATITEHVRREVDAGRITNRAGVVKYLQDQGYTLPRGSKSKDYLTITLDPSLPPQRGRLRLQGGLYREQDWNPREQEVPGIHYGVADLGRAAELAAKLDPMIAARSRFHQQRYGMPEYDGEPELQRGPGRGVEPLREYMARRLGSDALREVWAPRRGRTGVALHERQQASGRERHDRAGATVTRRLAAFGAELQRAGRRFAGAVAALDGANERLERGSRAVAASAATLDPWDWLMWQFYGREQDERRDYGYGRDEGIDL